VAAVVERDGRLLLGLRPEHKRHGGLWEFPGGKIDDGEDHASAARRELLEELDLHTQSVGARLFTVEDAGSPFVIEFYAVEVAGTPVAREHAALEWFTLEALDDLPLAPADRAFAGWYAGRSTA
jgi:8-oxo-dGTP diphosphatase